MMLAVSHKVAVSAAVSTDETSDWSPLESDTALIDDSDLDDGLPADMGLRVRTVTVRPHEVERGDFLVGLPRSMVAGVLYDGAVGRWLYTDDRGVRFASRKPWEQVQVVRGVPAGVRQVRHLRMVR